MATTPRARRRLAVGLSIVLLAGLVAVAAFAPGRDSAVTAPAPPLGPAGTASAGPQQQFVRVVQALSPSVVQIESRLGLGSGVVFDAHGDVVTNAHVVAGANTFTVTLAGGDRHRATLVGADRSHDLAVVHLDGATPRPAAFAEASDLEVGDLVLAIGNPLGLRSSVTQGIVSSLDRMVSEGNGVTLSPAIQTTAAINPGNSGGALADLSGRVVGIPTLAALDPQLGGGPATGIGFAIPSATVHQVATQLLAQD
jgi:putative serine protease PepD